MKFYDRTGKQHKSFVGAMTNSLLSKVDETLTKKARGYREAGEDRYDETPGAYNDWETAQNEPVEVPYMDAGEADDYGLGPVSTATASVITQPEEKAPAAQKISIDYAHQRLILEDADGNIVAASPIDEKLVRGTIDGTLLDVLYPDGNVPEAVKMNVGTIPVSAKAVILDTDGNPFPPTDNTTPPDGACG